MEFKVLSSLRLIVKEARVVVELIRLLLFQEKQLSVKNPVMFIPGFMFSDLYLLPIIRYFRKKGVPTYGWKMGVNRGYSEKRKERLVKIIDQILEKREAEEIILIGWSMGGVYAREIAHEYPQKVKLVLALATPFQIEGDLFRVIYSLISENSLDYLNKVMGRQKKYQIPAIQVYTKEDGIISWKSCFAEGYSHKEVKGTHLGMPYHNVLFEILKPSL